jgi:uncharacterized protein (DUF362 family)
MKNLKSILIYVLLGVLCIAAVVTTVTSKQAGKTVSNSKTAVNATANTSVENTGEPENTDLGNKTSNIPSDEQTRINEIMKKSQELVSMNPTVGIGQGKDYVEVTRTAIKNAGGLENIIKKGNVVLIKPNVCVMAGTDDPRITDYRIVMELAEAVKKLGASKIIVAEGSFSGYTLEVAGYTKIPGVEIIDFNEVKKEDCYMLKPEKSLTGQEIAIPKIYMQADVVINVAKLKTHFMPDAVVTLSLKNSMGVPPMPLMGLSYKEALHNFGLKESIVDLNKIRKPDFNIIDGIVGGEGYGPSNNDPVDSQIIFASTDPVALDTAAAYYMGFSIEDIPHLKLAADEKLGIGDLSKINIVGADLEKIKKSFKR